MALKKDKIEIKRLTDMTIDKLVHEGLKLIRFASTQIIKQADKIRKKNPDVQMTPELTFLSLLSEMPPNGELPEDKVKTEAEDPSTLKQKQKAKEMPEKSAVSQTRFNNYNDIVESRPDDGSSNEIDNFLDDFYELVPERVKNHSGNQRKLRAYAARIKKNQLKEAVEYIVERPSVFRNLIVMIDKRCDQILLTFKEQKDVFVRKLDKLLKISNMELYSQKETVVVPKKLDSGVMKGVYVYYLVRSFVLRPDNLDEMIIKFKTSVLRARIKDVTLPVFSPEIEEEILENSKKEEVIEKKERKKRSPNKKFTEKEDGFFEEQDGSGDSEPEADDYDEEDDDEEDEDRMKKLHKQSTKQQRNAEETSEPDLKRTTKINRKKPRRLIDDKEEEPPIRDGESDDVFLPKQEEE